MEKLFVKAHFGNDKWDIPLCYYAGESDTQTALVFVGGWGDKKEVFDGIVKKLQKKLYPSDIATFSFRGYEDGKIYPASTQVDELKTVLRFLKKKKSITNVKLFVTSMGAYGACYVLADAEFSNLVAKVLFFDPADYYIGEESDSTWSGYEDFKPDKVLVSSMLREIHSSVLINVVHLTLRNHGPSGYISDDLRKREYGSPDSFPRLNTAMVKAMYNKLPEANRGKYIELGNVPHGFIRDGNLRRNEKLVSELITHLL